jgi:lysylphosphatidylglycerol synthetase-like protein (DUF2156 family)/UDP-2,3-diacylglucosamine pyrophosphatase LpxH
MGDMAGRPVVDIDCEVHDHLDVGVPLGGRALVVSDLHLTAPSTAASRQAVRELGQALEGWAGPGVLVLLGDVLELLLGDAATTTDPAGALAAHSHFCAALKRFSAEPGRRIVYVIGNHDGRIAWDAESARTVVAATGASLCLTADLRFATGVGPRTVRVEHGHRLDPSNAFADPRNPLDIPLGHHVVREALPALEGATWLSGVEHLADPASIPNFIASRLAYRKMARYLGWLAVPLLLALAVKIPLVVALAERRGRAGDLAHWSHRLLMIGGVVFVDVALVGVTVALGARQVWRALAGSLGALGSRDGNRAAQIEAESLVAQGYAGFITGHTHRAELRAIGVGFYANTGCCDEILVERAARLGLPPVFGAEQERSWVELEAGAELRVRLHHTRTPEGDERTLERIVARRRPETPLRPVVVAEYPHGPSWPQDETSLVRLRSIRRRASAALAVAGVLNLVSAVTPPLRDRLSWLLVAVPLAVPQVAAVGVALAGLGLLLLGRGVRRGQRRAWLVSLGLVLGSIVLHLAKGVDVEEVVVASGVAGYLLIHRRAFRVASDAPSARLGLVWAAAGAAIATAVGTAAAWLIKTPDGRLPLHRAALAVLGRLVGVGTIAVAPHLEEFLAPVLGAVGFGLVALLGWQLLRPVIHRVVDHGRAARARATRTVARYGADSLAYFALRDDKNFFFYGETVVAYAVIGGVALVSPDPIGPVGERAAAWAAFRRFADESGWIVAGMGASEEWLPIYTASGLRTMYVGDEAVVDCSTFTLDGSRMKSLRQAYNRVARGGYTVEFHDPAKIDPALADQLRELSRESRRGEAERGFSMTLGRIFSPEDTGLLLAVCRNGESDPVAFCQYVPAPGIGGFSLDLMRRSIGQHPNGLLDFVLIETILHLKAAGHRGLTLNFATLRAVLAGETGDGVSQRIERWLLQKMSGPMQIESLRHFNAKYDPEWSPRYAVYESPGNMLPSAWAVAKAESFVDLPLIGRMFTPKPVEAA